MRCNREVFACIAEEHHLLAICHQPDINRSVRVCHRGCRHRWRWARDIIAINDHVLRHIEIRDGCIFSVIQPIADNKFILSAAPCQRILGTADERVVALAAIQGICGFVVKDNRITIANDPRIQTVAEILNGIFTGHKTAKDDGSSVEQVISCAPIQAVISTSAMQRISTIAAKQCVLSRIPLEVVLLEIPRQLIISFTTEQQVKATASKQCIFTSFTIEQVRAILPLECVVAVEAVLGIVPIATFQVVVSGKPIKKVIATAARDQIVAASANNLVIADRPFQILT